METVLIVKSGFNNINFESRVLDMLKMQWSRKRHELHQSRMVEYEVSALRSACHRSEHEA